MAFRTPTPGSGPSRLALLLAGAVLLVLGGAIIGGAVVWGESRTDAVSTTGATAAPEAAPEADDPTTTSTTTSSSGVEQPGQETGAGASGGGTDFSVCTDCHSNFDAFLRRSAALVDAFSHELHLENGASCADCHQQPTHTPEGIRKPTMASCYTCHDLESATAPPGACEACHPPSFPLVPESHRQQDWLPETARLDEIQALHAADAQTDRASCLVCHTQDFCTGCHGVEMPHPAGWQDEHARIVRETEAQGSCARCHPERLLCTSCHHPDFDPQGPPWRLQHPGSVAQRGATSCFVCHNSATCAHCHTTGEYEEL